MWWQILYAFFFDQYSWHYNKQALFVATCVTIFGAAIVVFGLSSPDCVGGDGVTCILSSRIYLRHKTKQKDLWIGGVWSCLGHSWTWDTRRMCIHLWVAVASYDHQLINYYLWQYHEIVFWFFNIPSSSLVPR